MIARYELPARDELGFCNILFAALGGDGANMAAKLLFKIGCTRFGLDGGYDAKYGSEKKGTPTDVSVRFCNLGRPVRQSGPTGRPHFLVAFHADLIEPLELSRGLHPNAVCIVNTHEAPQRVRQQLKLHSGKIVCVDATKIAYECRSRLNMPLLGALCHELAFPDEEIKSQIAAQWPQAAAVNVPAFERAVEECKAGDLRSATFDYDGRFELVPPAALDGPIGYRNMLNGGTIDALIHNTKDRDNRLAGRGRVPAFHPEACNSCGICLTVCSDPGGLLWREGRMQGIDPLFCKGCMRCVEVCPTTKKGKALAIPENGY